MNIFLRILQKCKSLFKKKEKVLALNETKKTNENKRYDFKKSLKVIVEKTLKKKKVETHINYGDGLGINNKMEF